MSPSADSPANTENTGLPVSDLDRGVFVPILGKVTDDAAIAEAKRNLVAFGKALLRADQNQRKDEQ